MPWKRGAELTNKKPGQVSLLHLPLQIQSLSLVDAADPSKGLRVRCLAASDKINSGRIRIRAQGWRIRKQGAPILYEHGQDPRIGRSPLGRWQKFEAQNGIGLVAEGVIDHFEAPDPRAAVVADIQAQRIVDVSVGHCPSKMRMEGKGEQSFLDVEETQLGEISFVSVGMDEEATAELMVASAFGFEWTEDAQSAQPGGIMDRKLLIQLLNLSGHNLAEDANEAQILAAVQKMSQSATLGSKAADVLAAIGLDVQASPDVVKTKVAELKNPANFVSKSEYDKLMEQTATATIEKLIAEHKQIPTGQVEFAKSLLAQGYAPETQGRKLFDSWVKTLPAIGTRQLTQTNPAIPPQNGGGDVHVEEITEEDREWCQLMGYFRDERGKDGKVAISGVERMSQMAEMSSAEALSMMFGQPVPETQLDKAIREQQQAAAKKAQARA